MTGTTTVVKPNISFSGRRLTPMLSNVSTSLQEVQRPLLTPDEVVRLPSPKKDASGNILEAGDMLIFVAGHPPIYGKQILYFVDPVFSSRAKIPAPTSSDRLTNENADPPAPGRAESTQFEPCTSWDIRGQVKQDIDATEVHSHQFAAQTTVTDVSSTDPPRALGSRPRMAEYEDILDPAPTVSEAELPLRDHVLMEAIAVSTLVDSRDVNCTPIAYLNDPRQTAPSDLSSAELSGNPAKSVLNPCQDAHAPPVDGLEDLLFEIKQGAVTQEEDP